MSSSKSDEILYGLAAQEIAEKWLNHDLLAKAYALALGDHDRTLAVYMRLRVEEMKNDLKNLEVRGAEEKRKREKEIRLFEKQEKIRLEKERLQKERAEAQRVGDAWAREEALAGGWKAPIPKEVSKPSSEPNHQGPPITPEELKKLVESLKKLKPK